MSFVPLRVDAKRMRPPSGDQTGAVSSAASEVTRVSTPLSTSSSTMSPLSARGARTLTATRDPFGDRATSP